MNDVTFNGDFWTVTTKTGTTYTFDPADFDIAYTEDFIEALQIWRNYLQTEEIKASSV